MVIHELKSWPEYFEAVRCGNKTFEIRKNDRNFQVGDKLMLHEFDPTTGKWLGRQICKEVTYISQGTFGLPDDICIMAIK